MVESPLSPPAAAERVHQVDVTLSSVSPPIGVNPAGDIERLPSKLKRALLIDTSEH